MSQNPWFALVPEMNSLDFMKKATVLFKPPAQTIFNIKLKKILLNRTVVKMSDIMVVETF